MFISKNNLLHNQPAISIKRGTNNPWVKGILYCSNEGRDPIQRGDDNNSNIWQGHW
jgi:hypothetical protein